jgi:hypothetical protein
LSGPRSSKIIIRNPRQNAPWGKEKRHTAPGTSSQKIGTGSPPPTFTVEGYNLTRFQGTVARSEQSCGLCSGVLTSVGSCRVFV